MAACKPGKSAIVTGSTKGIGLECVKALLDNNVKNIMMSSRSSYDQVAKVIEGLEKKYPGCKICYNKCDVTKHDDLKHLFEVAKSQFGTIDILVNNAGIMDEDNWNGNIDINVKGVIMGTQLGFEYMGKDKNGHGGAIVNMSSVLGVVPLPSSPTYVASKHAVIGYTRSVGTPFYYDKTHVKVMAMLPGLTDTPLISGAKERLHQHGNENLKLWSQEIQYFNSQPAHYPGLCLIKMLKEGENGSLWVTESEQIYTINIPDFQTMKSS